MKIKTNGTTKKPKTRKAAKSSTARASTAGTIARILAFLNEQRIFAKRVNVIGVPIHGEGGTVGFRPSTMSGFPDILAVCSVVWGSYRLGLTIAVEVKTGKDRLRPEQEGVHSQLRKVGSLVMVVKDFDDFEQQWNASGITKYLEKCQKNVGFVENLFPLKQNYNEEESFAVSDASIKGKSESQNTETGKK